VNDAGKWIRRIQLIEKKARTVINETSMAVVENRIKTTPAQFAEQMWKEIQ
jgi:hypothetical protein